MWTLLRKKSSRKQWFSILIMCCPARYLCSDNLSPLNQTMHPTTKNSLQWIAWQTQFSPGSKKNVGMLLPVIPACFVFSTFNGNLICWLFSRMNGFLRGSYYPHEISRSTCPSTCASSVNLCIQFKHLSITLRPYSWAQAWRNFLRSIN